MATIDPFGRTDKLDDNMLAALVTRFEARGKNPRFARMLDEYLNAMSIERTARVLDMACGTGLAARAIARRANFSGHVTGVDLSPYLVAAAKRLAGEERLAAHLEFLAGDVRKLNFSDGSFDALIAHTLLIGHRGVPKAGRQGRRDHGARGECLGGGAARRFRRRDILRQ